MFVYEICPQCMDQLYERKQPIDDTNSVNFCPKCGKKMECACVGEQRIDDTIYKIILNDASIPDLGDKKNKFIDTLMHIGAFDLGEAQRLYGAENSIIFEGNVSATYVNINLLEDFVPDIHYTVIPPFPFECLLNPFISICPFCGNNTVHRTEEVNNRPDDVKDGIFCETCNDWIMSTICSKLQIDDTKYCMEASLEDVDNKIREKILSIFDNLCNRKLEQNRIIAIDRARNLENLLSIMEAYSISYKVTPPYPHKVPELKPTYKNEWTEEDIRELMEANPGLKITAEEMNALS